jgi:hypothetical protein
VTVPAEEQKVTAKPEKQQATQLVKLKAKRAQSLALEVKNQTATE